MGPGSVHRLYSPLWDSYPEKEILLFIFSFLFFVVNEHFSYSVMAQRIVITDNSEQCIQRR
uniref:Uncharacterized protein n=1 Tax=Nelumbo nucifera TaxID=4432 RepID=A0A822Y8A5_NELNU|nr:TPA_asm: hypothetical protein HUJ06_029970 [Nelumbo nucifera]